MRYFLILFLSYINLMACSYRNEANLKTDTTKTIIQYFQNFNNHHWKALSEMYADSCASKDPDIRFGMSWLTPSQIEKKYSELQAFIPNIRDSIVAIYPCERQVVVVEFISKGTTLEGEEFKLPICTIFEFNLNGKIVKDYTYYDNF